MSKNGPVLIIEDDLDDQSFFLWAFEELQVTNEINLFENCASAYNYLQKGPTPFLIISDINLPGLNGLELKRSIDNDPELREKSIPFIFMSTASDPNLLKEAYTQMNIQGFFQKPATMIELKKIISLVVDYWKIAKHPESML